MGIFTAYYQPSCIYLWIPPWCTRKSIEKLPCRFLLSVIVKSQGLDHQRGHRCFRHRYIFPSSKYINTFMPVQIDQLFCWWMFRMSFKIFLTNGFDINKNYFLVLAHLSLNMSIYIYMYIFSSTNHVSNSFSVETRGLHLHFSWWNI